MVDNTVELIRRILSGDDEAFSLLMRKHQEGVHALIWRKIGDFYITEELTQDTFIQAYKKLGTLKDPRRFKGWLYVIANRRCLNWIKRNKAKMNALNMQSLENTPSEEIEEASYVHHIPRINMKLKSLSIDRISPKRSSRNFQRVNAPS